MNKKLFLISMVILVFIVLIASCDDQRSLPIKEAVEQKTELFSGGISTSTNPSTKTGAIRISMKEPLSVASLKGVVLPQKISSKIDIENPENSNLKNLKLDVTLSNGEEQSVMIDISGSADLLEGKTVSEAQGELAINDLSLKLLNSGEYPTTLTGLKFNTVAENGNLSIEGSPIADVETLIKFKGDSEKYDGTRRNSMPYFFEDDSSYSLEFYEDPNGLVQVPENSFFSVYLHGVSNSGVPSSEKDYKTIDYAYLHGSLIFKSAGDNLNEILGALKIKVICNEMDHKGSKYVITIDCIHKDIDRLAAN